PPGLLFDEFHPTFLTRVAEYEDHPADRPRIVPDRSGTIFDDGLVAVPGDEHRVIGDPHGVPSLQRPLDRALGRLPRALFEDGEDLFEHMPRRLPGRPAGELLGDVVHEGDTAVGIGRDDGVADARERPGEPPALLTLAGGGPALARHERDE